MATPNLVCDPLRVHLLDAKHVIHGALRTKVEA